MTTYLGENYTVKATITDKQGILFDPDSHNIILKDPRRTHRDTAINPTRLSLGIFEKTFAIPASGPEGVWTIEWRAIIGSESEMERFSFGVVA